MPSHSISNKDQRAIVTATEPLLLEATGVAKNYGAVTALKDASLSVRRGEVHALMGANGAGKSTLVKILTGAIRPTRGDILIRGKPSDIRSPADARRAGVVSVYQEPSLIPRSRRPLQPPLDRHAGRAVPRLGQAARHRGPRSPRDRPQYSARGAPRPRPCARTRRRARPLLLDEMTAALPANLAERVLDVVRRQTETGRSVIFISHRMLEIAALCDRATVLRDGRTVGVVDVKPGAEETIVELMLGDRIVKAEAARASGAGSAAAPPPDEVPRMRARNLQVGTKLQGVSFDLRPGEVLGLVALEGQGQDELFGVLSGSSRPAGGGVEVDGREQRFHHPADAIAVGVVLVPGDRTEGLCMQRPVRENIPCRFSARIGNWGPIRRRMEKERVDEAIRRLQIDTRAQAEVQRLSAATSRR